MICQPSRSCHSCTKLVDDDGVKVRACQEVIDYKPGSLSWMNGPSDNGKIVYRCRTCEKYFMAYPKLADPQCPHCKAAAVTRERRQGQEKKRKRYFSTIPGVIVRLLRDKGVSMNQFEKAIGAYKGASSKWNNGKEGMTEKTLDAACKYFGIEHGVIAIERKGKAPNTPPDAAGVGVVERKGVKP